MHAVRIAANFEQNLQDIEQWLDDAGMAGQFNALLDALAGSVLPALAQFPAMGRPFLSKEAMSIEAGSAIASLRAAAHGMDIREYLLPDYLILYAYDGSGVVLLSIRHHRQLSFDLAGHWS